MAGAADWRRLDGGRGAWFDAPSLAAGAALVGAVVRAAASAGAPVPDMDVRPDGVRLHLRAEDGARAANELEAAVSRAARGLGLVPDPAALQTSSLVVETADPSGALRFWGQTSGYDAVAPDRLEDPGARHGRVVLRRQDAPRPLRGRVHVDVVRPAPAVDRARAVLGVEATGPYGVRLADPDGTEVDLVPGDALPGGEATEDWHALFAAVVRYRVASADQAAELVTAVAALADEASVPLWVDVRRGAVTLDSGKDRWEPRFAGGGFPALAARVQAAARERDLVADGAGLRFVQLGLDVVDVPAAQRFWGTVLGHEQDEHNPVDLHHPRGSVPDLLFQQMEPADDGRLAQPNRVRPVLHVPADGLPGRLAAVAASGGRVLDQAADRVTVADPEGNELEVVAG